MVFNDICYLVIGSFDWKIGIIQELWGVYCILSKEFWKIAMISAKFLQRYILFT